MKVPSFCFVLTVAISISTSPTVVAQESGDDPRLEQMQATIVQLQAELDSMKAAQASGQVPTLATPGHIVAPPRRHLISKQR